MEDAQDFHTTLKWLKISKNKNCKHSFYRIKFFRIFEKDGAQFLVDETTLDFINGSIIDYKSEMIKSSFEVAENPNAEMGCSCGTSFSPKDK